jgi:hypothetical protein
VALELLLVVTRGLLSILHTRHSRLPHHSPADLAIPMNLPPQPSALARRAYKQAEQCELPLSGYLGLYYSLCPLPCSALFETDGFRFSAWHLRCFIHECYRWDWFSVLQSPLAFGITNRGISQQYISYVTRQLLASLVATVQVKSHFQALKRFAEHHNLTVLP